MTKASEVTVTDAELLAFRDATNISVDIKRERIRRALAAFLAARVPDEKLPHKAPARFTSDQAHAWCCGTDHIRDAVLRGPE